MCRVVEVLFPHSNTVCKTTTDIDLDIGDVVICCRQGIGYRAAIVKNVYVEYTVENVEGKVVFKLDLNEMFTNVLHRITAHHTLNTLIILNYNTDNKFYYGGV